MWLLVEAWAAWVAVGFMLFLGRPDLAQPLAMLGTTLVNAYLNRKKDREARSSRSRFVTP